MLFKLKEKRVIIMGLNSVSLDLARNLSLNRDVIILYNNNRNKKIFNYNIDVIIEEIKFNLVDQLIEYFADGQTIFISLTEDDEYNIFTAQLAKKLGAKMCITGVNNNDYLKIGLDLDLIFNPLQLIIDKINSLLKNIRFKKNKNLIPGKVNITQLSVKNNDSFSYCRLGELTIKEGIIVAIKRGDRIFIPDSSIKILPGDILYILYKKYFTSWLKIFETGRFNRNKLFIIGSGITGRYFIDYWENIFEPVIVIEPDLQKCNNLAVRFEKPLILHGEVTDLQLLREEGIDEKSIFIASSNHDYYNLLGSYGALSLGCKNVLTLLNKEENKEIANYLKLNSVIFKAKIISEHIISFLETGLRKINKYILGKEIYALEIEIKNNSRVKNIELKRLKLPDGVLIGVIIRAGKVIIPDGETKLKDKDMVVVFFNNNLENKIGRIFS